MPLNKKLKGKMNKIKTQRFRIAIPSIILSNLSPCQMFNDVLFDAYGYKLSLSDIFDYESLKK